MLADFNTLPASAGYAAAYAGVALHPPEPRSLILLRDRDRLALLHRLSTQDLLPLQAGQGTRTVLTNHNGRIIDLLTLYARQDEALLVTGTGQGSVVLSLLRKNIFFNDKIKLEDGSARLQQLAISGPQAFELLATLGLQPPADLALHAHVELSFAEQPVWVAAAFPLGGPAFNLFVPAELAEQLRSRLLAAGAQPLSPAEHDILRVEHGYGASGRELSLEYIPLETGLLDAISFSKGCYVGQEIIARMESRNRLAKRLRGLRLDAPLELTATRKLLLEGRDAGDLTSAVVSPRFGPIGLGYVRSAYCESGSRLALADSPLLAEVVDLPFVAPSSNHNA